MVPIVSNPKRAQYIGFVAYSRSNNGKSSIVSTRLIFGQTGGGTTSSSSTVYGSGRQLHQFRNKLYDAQLRGVVGSSCEFKKPCTAQGYSSGYC